MKRGDIIVDPDGRELRFSGYRGDRAKFYGGIFVPREVVEGWNDRASEDSKSMDDGSMPNAGGRIGGDAGGRVGTDGTDSSGERVYPKGASEWGSADDNAAYTTPVEDDK